MGSTIIFFCSKYQQRVPYDLLCGLASALLDGTVFEIVRSLKEVQHLEERNLYNQRSKLINEYKGLYFNHANVNGNVLPNKCNSTLEISVDKTLCSFYRGAKILQSLSTNRQKSRDFMFEHIFIEL